MRLLVGLGNPGARYVDTRHNIGFRVVEAIAKRHGIGSWGQRFKGLACEGSIAGEHVLLLLPGTYMNESGRAVAQAARDHRLLPDDITVFHDDIERRPGNVRVKIDGGDRGHNGLRSITAHVGKDYRRVQIGVGRPEFKHLVESYVLSKFADVELAWFNMLAETLAENVDLLVRGEGVVFEKRVNSAIARFV
jgi:peptidyl-tRNA hydrolase, PTH1 family